MEDDYQPISAYELPPHIIEVLYEQFNTFTLVHAFKGDKEGFKLELIFENGAIHVIYTDKNGQIQDSTEGQ
ncbi:hypothetical protein KCTC52924_01645 [Arenibacter antarcticus]|uniref:Beta-lactamase-inhibitor-like, PepSY-like n=1 Tax=Arenibacter antarcticus TaxID=2040469 RepID=A0ABW5VL86_9FLAO|nr:hypothetical protein [Arenibacter sp. H213]MCM4166792.1 hypothetical protein [Arenibacter sp. H213]